MMANPVDGPLVRLVRQHRWRLLLTYLLLMGEAVVDLLQPLALGWAIEAFLTGQSGGLALFALQQSVGWGLGVSRRLWDARFFNRVAADLAEELVLGQRAAGVELSSIAARAGLSNQLVDFLERDIPFIFHSVIQGIGAIVMLGLVAPRLLPLGLVIVVPALGLSALYAGFSRRGTGRLHDEMERTVWVLGDGAPEEVRTHFRAIAGVRQFLARAETAYFGVWQVVGLGFIAATFTCDPSPGRTAGVWTAILGYAQLLLLTLVNLPRLIDQFIRLRDITGRFRGPSRAPAREETPECVVGRCSMFSEPSNAGPGG